MNNSKKIKKMIAAAMFGVMTISVVGTSAAIAEASPRYTVDASRTMDMRTSYGDSLEMTQLARRKKSKKGYSKGSVTTAAIVGAVVGAIIAKNT